MTEGVVVDQDRSNIRCKAFLSPLSVLALIGLPIGLGCLGRFRKTLLTTKPAALETTLQRDPIQMLLASVVLPPVIDSVSLEALQFLWRMKWDLLRLP